MRSTIVVVTFVLCAVATRASAGGDCRAAPGIDRLLDLDPLETRHGEQTCVRGRFERGDGWLLGAAVRDHAAAIDHQVFVVTDKRGRRLSITREPHRGHEVCFDLERAIDVDGDGVMEVVAEETRHVDDAVTRRLVVLAIRRGEVLRLLDVPFFIRVDVDHRSGRPRAKPRKSMLSCTSTYAVVADGKRHRLEIARGVVEREADVAASETFDREVCATEKRTFAFSVDRGLAEVGAPGPDPFAHRIDARCPSLRRLAALLGVPAGQTVSEARCTPARLAKPALVIFATVDDASELALMESAKRRVLIVDAGERVIASDELTEYADVTGVGETHVLIATGDLDRDGRDELVVEKTLATPMGSDSTVEVYRVRGGKLARVLEAPFRSTTSPDFVPQSEHDAPGLDPATTLSCEASAAIDNGELVVVRSVRRGANVKRATPADFCAGHRRRWRFDRGGRAKRLE